MSLPTPIRVLVVDDNPLFIDGLRLMLLKAKDVEVIGAAKNGQEAVLLAERLSPHVVLMDLNMPGMDGWQATERIQELRRNTAIVILSMHVDGALVDRARKQKVQGYLLKNSGLFEIIAAIRGAVQGKKFFGTSVIGFMSQTANPPDTKFLV